MATLIARLRQASEEMLRQARDDAGPSQELYRAGDAPGCRPRTHKRGFPRGPLAGRSARLVVTIGMPGNSVRSGKSLALESRAEAPPAQQSEARAQGAFQWPFLLLDHMRERNRHPEGKGE